VPWPEIGIFWASVILALITVTATTINHLFFRSQIEPDVLIYATSDERRPSIIVLVIENVGKGLARNVTFSADKPIPEKAFGFENAKTPSEMKTGPLITGIPSLAPGSKRIITWGQYYGLLKGIGTNVINVEVRFESRRSILLGYKKHRTVCPVDILSFAGTDASDNNWDKMLHKEVKSIASVLRESATGDKPIKIEVVGSRDRCV
jgi:hypothetical protein